LATTKVEATEAGANAQRESQNRELTEAVALEIRLAEAKANGNKEEARRLEWLQRYHSELKRLGEAMPEAQAREAATRLANAQDALSNQNSETDRGQSGALYASSLARIGAGGNAVGGGSDPILNENRRQTSILERINRTLAQRNQSTEPMRIEMVLS
jgi:hypothetical protein